MRSERQYLEELRQHIADTRRYLRERCKPERERAVCRAFLRCIGITFVDSEIVAPAVEPADVSFREARFQIREVLEKDRRRGDEWKVRQIRASRARSIDDVATSWRPPTSMLLKELTASITLALEEKARKYGRRQCSKVDALVYVNLTTTRFLDPASARGDISGLEAQRWRSVSIVFPPYVMVLFATDSAPHFLQQFLGRLQRKWSDVYELFEVQSGI